MRKMQENRHRHARNRLLILSLISCIFVFSLLSLSVDAENTIIEDDEFSSFVSVTSFSDRTRALTLSSVEGNNISILYPNMVIDIIGAPNTTYKVQLGTQTIENGTLPTEHIQIRIHLNETKSDLNVIVGPDIHRFGMVIIKKQLSKEDIGEMADNTIEITKDEFTWAQWQAGLGAFIGSLLALPMSYVAVKFYLEKRGEYAT